jgi:hypothetical membrane protein
VVSAVIAPVAMIGGWQLAAARQPPGYSAIRDTISALAGHGAHDRWVMTLGLVVVGCCHLVTAAGLPVARPAGRILLAVGGAATVAVAALPQPVSGSAPGHTLAAGTAFLALTFWSLAAYPAGAPVGVLRLPILLPATVALVGLLVVFYLELHGGHRIGLTERLLAGAQSVWPVVILASVFLAGKGKPARPAVARV